MARALEFYGRVQYLDAPLDYLRGVEAELAREAGIRVCEDLGDCAIVVIEETTWMGKGLREQLRWVSRLKFE